MQSTKRRIVEFCQEYECILADVRREYIIPHFVINLTHVFQNLGRNIYQQARRNILRSGVSAKEYLKNLKETEKKIKLEIKNEKRISKKLIINIVYGVVRHMEIIIPFFNSFIIRTDHKRYGLSFSRNEVVLSFKTFAFYIPIGTKYLFGKLGFLRSSLSDPILEKMRLVGLANTLKRVSFYFGERDFDHPKLFRAFMLGDGDKNFELFTKRIQNLFHPSPSTTLRRNLEHLNFEINLLYMFDWDNYHLSLNIHLDYNSRVEKIKTFKNPINTLMKEVNHLFHLKTLSLKFLIGTRLQRYQDYLFFKSEFQITLPNLKNIDLLHFTLTKDSIFSLKNNVLEVLELNYCLLDHSFLNLILHSKSLKKIKLNHCTFPDKMMDITILSALLDSRNLPRLTTLYLSGISFLQTIPVHFVPINMTIKTLVIDVMKQMLRDMEHNISSILNIVKKMGGLKSLFLLDSGYYGWTLHGRNRLYNLIAKSTISDQINVVIPFADNVGEVSPELVEGRYKIDVVDREMRRDSLFLLSSFISSYNSDRTLVKFDDFLILSVHGNYKFRLEDVFNVL